MSLLSHRVGIGRDVSNHFMWQTNLVRSSGKVARRPIPSRNHERATSSAMDKRGDTWVSSPEMPHETQMRPGEISGGAGYDGSVRRDEMRIGTVAMWA